MDNFKVTTISRIGRCIGCGREIKPKEDKIIRFTARKSNVYGCSLCFDCIKKLNELIKED